MRQGYFSPKLSLKKKQKSVENDYDLKQQKSFKDLILTKPKHNIIDRVQSKLAFTNDLRILDRTLFYLACYISHYQSLHTIISKGLKNQEVSFNNFKNNQSSITLRKNQENPNEKDMFTQRTKKNTQKNLLKSVTTQKLQNPCNKLISKRSKPDIISHTERSNHQSKDVKVIMDSYRYICLKQFFHIQQYSQKNILQTVFNKIREKIVKNQIGTVESHPAVSIKRISINYHKRQPSYPKNIDQRQQNHKNKTLFPEIQSSTMNLKKGCRNLMKKPSRFDELDDLNDKTKASPTPTLKSFKSESRRNGLHEVNKILTEIQNLKQALNCSFLKGDQVTEIAADIKQKLNNLLNHLKVKPINLDQKTKDGQFLKIR